MTANSEALQVITRLTPLADVLALVDRRVRPVAPREIEVAAAAGRVLAADIVAPARPATAIALLDGWALRADDTLGAGGYAPALLLQAPPRVDVGQRMPPGTDSVAPLDAVTASGSGAEALAALAPGDGVLPAGGDCDRSLALGRAGEFASAARVAALAAAGIAHVSLREPRLRVLPLRDDAIVNAAARLVASDIGRRGGVAQLDLAEQGLRNALADETADAIIAVGGTGSGRNDNSVDALSRRGEVAVHGIALTPGETAALGFVGPRPVLLLPGRLDAALSVWLVVGRHLLARLCGRSDDAPAAMATLTRKVTSTVSLAEFVPVRRSGGGVEPLAAKYLPLSALARADGWILVPAESEGYPAGASVTVRAWP